ncbi:MAG: DEAD/DEAH box helicase family protein, partial [Bacteroidales bacterium]|nr:DEAD/DEAH box helicase family protein [Bacteroidales bacterium]
MAEKKYISVIVPLRLEWEPCYWTDEEVVVGQAVRVPIGARQYIGVVSAVGIAPTLSPARIRGIVGPEPGLPRISETEIGLWRQVAEYYLCTVGEVFKSAYPTWKIVSEQKAAELKRKEAKKRKKTDKQPQRPEDEIIREARDRVRLTEAQLMAEGEILAAFAQGKPTLLNGVPGSGKTEIYTSLAIRALEAGRNVLYLVPEIMLSRQLEARMRDVFGDLLQIFHSKETPARRQAVSDAVRSGRRYIVLGARSALFLPHHDLGLVIVDEEHDSSYKQDAPVPHYNGRDTALMLSALHGCNVVLGSATPS